MRGRLVLVAIWLAAVLATPATAQEAVPGHEPTAVEEPAGVAEPEAEPTPPGDAPIAPGSGPPPAPSPALSPSVPQATATDGVHEATATEVATPEPEPAGASTRARRAVRLAAATVGVSAVDDAFRPMELVVTAGTEVVWTNAGNNPHTVTADDRAFDSGTLEGGQTFSVVFEEPGRVPYYCQIHGEPGSGMFGFVIVRPAPAPAAEEDDATSSEEPLARTGVRWTPLGAAIFLLAVGVLAFRLGRRWVADVDNGSMDTDGRRGG